ncbi:putative snRNP Sm-like protein [Marine Group I thaumarchaeote SCGC AAA799-E16]|uniref:Putative snRNP Sm-like protein n=5 Tax=Marine Group I TaxID=905826 RepID=A0A087S7E9_9ARCH|nr:Putative snRNP Sm-like protein [Marine Group I thaumarchaeote SCGC AAA799-N04]KER05999.1 putative snRNP Sm-like protein [Marine Group I thaumarchaeote SCGC AAA799-E16]KFM18018.1 putative snRNP Sm-like protein [Marine Group I thaumarchaeote SCGC RSA3]KFM18135.1 putative snRNP Sm-like protein [Marine Group I thaumarchaeote SCGC AAA799-P11]KFM21653.1 putative snRNP Sm-like protein [Marine Group I thaumarchaeote SCGC AAA799-B03]
MSENFSMLFLKCINKKITLRMNNGKTINGMLVEYDEFMNMTLNDAREESNENFKNLGNTLIRGSSITAIVLPDEN